MKDVLIQPLQAAIRRLDGWLFYSFRGSDPIADILRLDDSRLAPRWR